MERELKVGDRVVVKENYLDIYNPTEFNIRKGIDGMTGEIVTIRNEESCYKCVGILFDEKTSFFHDLIGNVAWGYGYWMSELHLLKENGYKVDLL